MPNENGDAALNARPVIGSSRDDSGSYADCSDDAITVNDGHLLIT